MDYTKKTVAELRTICREKGIRGFSGKKKKEIVGMILGTAPAGAPPREKPQLYTVISLFSGMGGMDTGFAEQVIVHKNSVQDDYVASAYEPAKDFVNLRRLPFTTVFQNDILPQAQRIAELNNWHHNYHLKDIRELLASAAPPVVAAPPPVVAAPPPVVAAPPPVAAAAKQTPFTFPHADVITGGFPCQDFSHAGKRQGFDGDRGTLYQSFVELVRRVKPIVFVAENVNGLLTMPGEPIKKIIADFSAVGYEVKYQLIKCEEYGIPQTRWRVIIMGVRMDKKPAADDWNIIKENKRHCHIGHYFQHLQEPSDTADPAQQVYSKAAKLAKGQGQKEVGMAEFAPTMRAEHHGNIEFRRVASDSKNNEAGLPERRLTVREAALIQTFPPHCILTEPAGKATSMAYKPIGNAVPPLLGYIIARKVLQILETSQAKN
jgi:DNA (cytosine-5)-methyltransferase 1